jgi:Flp pilus assembly protein TadG
MVMLNMRSTKSHKVRGVALVEFALVLPLLLLLSFITTEFGRALYEYNTVVKSVRNAARFLSVQTPGTQTTEARNMVVYGNAAGTGQPLALGLTLARVPTPTWQTVGVDPLIQTVTVRVSGYSFTPLFTGTLGLSMSSLSYSDISATMRAAL